MTKKYPLRVLVLDGNTKPALAVTRSLGSLGHCVGVQASAPGAIAARSRFASEVLYGPDQNRESDLFAHWLRSTVLSWKPDVLIPITSSALEVVLADQDFYRSQTCLPFISKDVYDQSQDKARLLKTAESLGINVPQTLNLPEEQAAIETFSYPAALKLNISDTRIGSQFVQIGTQYPDSAESTRKILSTSPELPFLLQQRITGDGIGVFVLCQDGKPLATFAHRRLLEKPPSGGVSVLSESIALDAAPVADAYQLLEHYKWNGVAMVEFKLSAEGKPYLMEINPRFWGSLQLSISSGCDFPKLLLDTFCYQEPPAESPTIKTNVRLRWLEGTLDHALIRLKHEKLNALSEIIFKNALYIGTSGVCYDVFRCNDCKPFFSAIRQWLRNLFSSSKRSSTPRTTALHVLFFNESGGPGGAEQMLVALAKGLREQGIQVSVVTLRSGWLTDTLDKEGIKRFQLSSSRRFDFSLPLRLSKLIKTENVDVLHSHLLDSNFYGALAARFAGVPHLGTEHGDVHHTSQKRFLKTKLRIISALGSTLVAVAEYTAQQLRTLGVCPRQVRTIPNPAPAPSAQQDNSEAIRKELHLEQDSWLWMHVANLRPVKDQQTLLRGFAKALSKSSDQQLCIVGDGPERAALETTVRELGILDKVTFLGFRDDVSRLLSAADGFVLSSRSEALPMSLLEAAQAQLLLVATDVGGISSIIVNQDLGYLFPANNSDALATALADAVQNPARSKEKARAAHLYIAEQFSLKSVVGRYISIYERLLG